MEGSNNTIATSLIEALIHSHLNNNEHASHIIKNLSDQGTLEQRLATSIVYLNSGNYEGCIDTLQESEAASDISKSLSYAQHLILAKAYFFSNDNDKALIELYRAKEVATESTDE